MRKLFEKLDALANLHYMPGGVERRKKKAKQGAVFREKQKKEVMVAAAKAVKRKVMDKALKS